MLGNRVERKCSRNRSPKRLPVSSMYILLQVRQLIAYTTFLLKQVYLERLLMCPPRVVREADELVCAHGVFLLSMVAPSPARGERTTVIVGSRRVVKGAPDNGVA